MVMGKKALTREEGGECLGLLTQMTPDREIELCGPGFSSETIKITFHGCAYFVFRKDLELRLNSSDLSQIYKRAVADLRMAEEPGHMLVEERIARLRRD